MNENLFSPTPENLVINSPFIFKRQKATLTTLIKVSKFVTLAKFTNIYFMNFESIFPLLYWCWTMPYTFLIFMNACL